VHRSSCRWRSQDELNAIKPLLYPRVVQNVAAFEPALTSGSPAEPTPYLNSTVLAAIVNLSVMVTAVLSYSGVSTDHDGRNELMSFRVLVSLTSCWVSPEAEAGEVK
jgi:hypothetical protein